MMKMHLLLLTLATLLVGVIGCTDQQLTAGDHFAADANTAAQAAKEIVMGPLGSLLPPSVAWILNLGIFGVTAGIGIWRHLVASGLLRRTTRLQQENTEKTAAFKAVVDGVTAAGKKADPVKAEIGRIMATRGIYVQANAIVDQVKTIAVKNS